MTKFKFELEAGNDNDDFEQKEKNIGSAIVLNKNGQEITQNCRIQLSLSKDGLIGLGTELIRLAHKFKDGKHEHIDPVSNENACQSMGIFLTPDSCEFIIECAEQGTIDDYLKKI